MIAHAYRFHLNDLLLQERCILDGTLTVNYEQVDVDYRLRHNDLLANIVHRYQILAQNLRVLRSATFFSHVSKPFTPCRHETPVLSKPIDIVHLSEDLVVLDKPCSLPVSSSRPSNCFSRDF